MDSRHFWDEAQYNIKYENYNSNDGYRVCDGNLNFSTGAPPSEDDADYSTGYLKKSKMARQDPLSHRIIEKRRRDRMNNCLADLSRLIPPEYLKKGRGRIEKTEIIEMAIKHLKYLKEKTRAPEPQEGPISVEHFRLGYQECLSEVMRYLVEHQGHMPTDNVCLQIVHHLQRHCDRITKSDHLNKPRSNTETTSTSSGSSSNYLAPSQSIIAQNLLQSDVNRVEAKNTIKVNENAVNSLSGHGPEEFLQSCNDVQLDRSFTQETKSESPRPSSHPSTTEYRSRKKEQNALLQKNSNHNGLPSETAELQQNGYHQQFEEDEASDYRDSPSVYIQREQILRNIRKLNFPADESANNNISIDHENAHLYKFKNTIQQRFSESQCHESRPVSPVEAMAPFSPGALKRDQMLSSGKSCKRRRGNLSHRNVSGNGDQSLYKGQTSTNSSSSHENAMNLSYMSQNFSKSSEDATETSDTRYDSQDYYDRKLIDEDIVPQSRHSLIAKYYKVDENLLLSPKVSRISVPIFALHTKGAFYVPLKIDYECLVPFLGSYDLLNVTGLNSDSSLHPVTISVNYQTPLFGCDTKEQSANTKSEMKEWQ